MNAGKQRNPKLVGWLVYVIVTNLIAVVLLGFLIVLFDFNGVEYLWAILWLLPITSIVSGIGIYFGKEWDTFFHSFTKASIIIVAVLLPLGFLYRRFFARFVIAATEGEKVGLAFFSSVTLFLIWRFASILLKRRLTKTE